MHRAKDGVMLKACDPEVIYGFKTHEENRDAETIEEMEQYFKEVPLGTGGVDFPAYLKALDDIGFKGFLTIEREVGDNPVADIQTAVNFLNGLIK